MLPTLPIELKVTYFIAFAILLVLFFFVLFIMTIYNKKKQDFIQEKIIHEQIIKNEKLEKELQIQKSLQEERDRISGEMHDEIGAGISAIKLQSEISKHRIEQKTFCTEDVEEIIRISDDMKTSLREMLWSLNSKNDILRKFAEHCHYYFDNYFAKTKIASYYLSDISEEDIIISSDYRRVILSTIKEACHNILKHSEATEVFLEIQNIGKEVTISISDNGKGFIADKNHNGYGLSSMKTRISLVKGKLSIDSSSEGTVLEIIINL
jgi:two-component system sensor histidine kinase DesK